MKSYKSPVAFIFRHKVVVLIPNALAASVRLPPQAASASEMAAFSESWRLLFRELAKPVERREAEEEVGGSSAWSAVFLGSVFFMSER